MKQKQQISFRFSASSDSIYRNTLPKEHNQFVREQLQKEYDTVTKTYELHGKVYTGTFREDTHRKENREAYAKEAKLATVLASFGFDVILIEEDNRISGTKPDAIVNGIVMDFKEVEALSEETVGKNALGKNYQKGMRKKFSEGVIIYLHNFSNEFVSSSMGFQKTSPIHNGLALFFHENTGALQLINMNEIRNNYERHFKGRPPGVSAEQPISRSAPSKIAEPTDNNTVAQSAEKSSSKMQKKKHRCNNDWER